MNTIDSIEEPAVKMLKDVVSLKIYGVHPDWKTYKFTLDVDTPGHKTIVFQLMSDTNKTNLTAESPVEPSIEQEQPGYKTLLKLESDDDKACDGLKDKHHPDGNNHSIVTATEASILTRFTRTLPDDDNPRGALVPTSFYVRPRVETAQEIVERLSKRPRLD